MLEENTSSLLNRIAAIITKYDKIAEITGERFNIFNILRLDSSEVKLHSALIAELLNPNGKHGCRNLFLNHFLESLKQTIEADKDLSTRIINYENVIENFRKEEINVEIEKGIGNKTVDDKDGGRIDIILTTGSGEAIVLENKIYADDQKGQLRRYYNYCKNTLHKEPIVMYLTLNGEAPGNYTTCNDEPYYSTEAINVVAINYKTFIIGWLEKCRENAVSLPLLRETITQYIYLLKQLTHQSTNENMKNEIAEAVAGNLDFISSAQTVWENQEAIKLQVIRNVASKLSEKAKGLGWSFDTSEESAILGKADSGFGFLLENNSYWIYFYFRSDFDNLEFGIDWLPNKPKDPILQKKLWDYFNQFEIGKEFKLDDWIWGCDFKPWSEARDWQEKLLEMPEAIIEKTEKLKGLAKKF